jgi:hypothetical protein
MMEAFFIQSNFPCLHDVDLAFLLSEYDTGSGREYGTAVHHGIRHLSAKGGNLLDFLPIVSLPELEFVALASYNRQEGPLRAFFKTSGAHVQVLAFAEDSLEIARLSDLLPSLQHMQGQNLKIFEDLVSIGATFPLLESVNCVQERLGLTEATVTALLSYSQQRWATMEVPTPLTISVYDLAQVDNPVLLEKLRACPQLEIIKAVGSLIPASLISWT